jgi:hypothetical protein
MFGMHLLVPIQFRRGIGGVCPISPTVVGLLAAGAAIMAAGRNSTRFVATRSVTIQALLLRSLVSS